MDMPKKELEEIGSLLRQAIDFEAQGGKNEALGLYEKSLYSVRTLAALHPAEKELQSLAAMVRGRLAGFLMKEEKYDDAEKYFRENLETAQKTLAKDTRNLDALMNLIGSLTNLGIALKAMKRFKEAEQAYTRAIAQYQKFKGPEKKKPEFRYPIASMQQSLGHILKELKKWEEAEKTYREALSYFLASPMDTPTAGVIADINDNLGTVLLNLKKPGEAKTAFLTAVNFYRDLLMATGEEQYHIKLGEAQKKLAGLG
jgi:tetratricopeptide (TPR) repeat protein